MQRSAAADQPGAVPVNPGSDVESWDNWTRVLGGRFEVRRSWLLGRGGYAAVRRGRDLQTRRMVAVKFYTEEGDDGTGGTRDGHPVISGETVSVLKREVTALAALHRATPEELTRLLCTGQTPSAKSGHKFLRKGSFTPVPETSTPDVLQHLRLEPEELFVKFIAHSQDADAAPGIEDGMCYMVQEFGLETLDQKIASEREFGETFGPVQVRAILMQLIQVVAALHALGFVHSDIKPSNFMRFKIRGKNVWKLIDLDGLVPTQSSVDPLTLPFTPLYGPPEIASALVRQDPGLIISRWMDVWSVGTCILDCILPQPLFAAEYQRGRDAFLCWLGSLSEVVMPAEAMAFDPALIDLLRLHILRPQPSERMSILELFVAMRELPLEGCSPQRKRPTTEDVGVVNAAPCGIPRAASFHTGVAEILFKYFDCGTHGKLSAAMLVAVLQKLDPTLFCGSSAVDAFFSAAGLEPDADMNVQEFAKLLGLGSP